MFPLPIDQSIKGFSRIVSTLNVEVLISVADRRKVVGLKSNLLTHCFEAFSTDVMASVVSGIHQVEDSSHLGALDLLQVGFVQWIRAKADWRVADLLEGERIVEVTVSLEECSIYSKDLVSVEPQAGVGVTKLATVRVGVLQVNAPHLPTSSLLKDSLLCESVLFDVSVGHLAIGASCELALFGLRVVERH